MWVRPEKSVGKSEAGLSHEIKEDTMGRQQCRCALSLEQRFFAPCHFYCLLPLGCLDFTGFNPRKNIPALRQSYDSHCGLKKRDIGVIFFQFYIC